MPPSPVTAEERARIVDQIRAGEKSCRQIAIDFGRSTATISRIAKAEGLTFDRSRTEAATRARQADNRARRAALAPIFLDRAEEALAKIGAALDRMEGPTLVFNFGGRDNTYEEHTLESPPTDVLRQAAATARDLMQAAKTANQAVLDMERIDRPDAGDGQIRILVEAIGKARESHTVEQ